MYFPFDIAKATDVASQLLHRAGGRMNVVKLVKLVYLLDRMSIDRRGIPVVGGAYFSMRNGPVTSELLDLVNAGRLWGSDDTRWAAMIGDRDNHDVALLGAPSDDHLAESELQLVDDVFRLHGARSEWQLVGWTHENCPEWTPLAGRREAIDVGRLAAALGKSDVEVERIQSEANELRFVEESVR